MERFGRRDFLVRADGLTLAAGTVGVGPALARWSGGSLPVSICNLSASGRCGTTHVGAFGQFFGSEGQLRALIAPLVNTGTPRG
jgi:hypothetical protein